MTDEFSASEKTLQQVGRKYRNSIGGVKAVGLVTEGLIVGGEFLFSSYSLLIFSTALRERLFVNATRTRSAYLDTALLFIPTLMDSYFQYNYQETIQLSHRVI